MLSFYQIRCLMFTHTLLMDFSWASLSELCLRGDNKLPTSPVTSDQQFAYFGLRVRSLRSLSGRKAFFG